MAETRHKWIKRRVFIRWLIGNVEAFEMELAEYAL